MWNEVEENQVLCVLFAVYLSSSLRVLILYFLVEKFEFVFFVDFDEDLSEELDKVRDFVSDAKNLNFLSNSQRSFEGCLGFWTEKTKSSHNYSKKIINLFFKIPHLLPTFSYNISIRSQQTTQKVNQNKSKL